MSYERQASGSSIAPRVLLVVEDDDLRDLLGEILVEEAFEVLRATTWEEAETQLQRVDVALVIHDLVTAPTDDADLWTELERVRCAAEPASVGILTGWNLEEPEVRARGYAFLLHKPCDLTALLGAVAQHTGGAVSEEQARTIRAYFDALSRKDWHAMVRLCTPDVVYHVPGTDHEFSRTVRGRVALRTYAAEAFASFADARFRVEALVPLPHAVAARYRASWSVVAGSGPGAAQTSMTGAVWFGFAGNEIERIDVRLDLDFLKSRNGPPVGKR